MPGQIHRQGTVVSSKTISIVIPTKDRSALLLDCLRSIERQSTPPDEVVIVDDSRTKPDVPDKMGTRINVIVDHSSENRSLGPLKNRGAQLAAGSILFFVDDDNVLHEDCLAALLRHISPSSCAVGTQVVRDSQTGKWRPEWGWISANPDPSAFLDYMAITSRPRSGPRTFRVPHPPNVFGLSREAFERSGGYSTDSFCRHYEDINFGRRLRQNGINCVAVTDALTFHKVHGGEGKQVQPVGWYVRGCYSRQRLGSGSLAISVVVSIGLSLITAQGDDQRERMMRALESLSHYLSGMLSGKPESL